MANEKQVNGNALVLKYTDGVTGVTVAQDKNSPYTILLMPIDIS